MLSGNFEASIQELARDMNNPLYAMVPVNGHMSLDERFNGICANYRAFQRLVDAGKSDWMRNDPYQIADWVSIFTPIEESAWGAGTSSKRMFSHEAACFSILSRR